MNGTSQESTTIEAELETERYTTVSNPIRVRI